MPKDHALDKIFTELRELERSRAELYKALLDTTSPNGTPSAVRGALKRVSREVRMKAREFEAKLTELGI